MAKANAFAEAASTAKAPGRSKKPPETVWALDEEDPLRGSLSDFVRCKRWAKDAEAGADVAQPALTNACWDRFLAHLVREGAKPGSTMRLVGADGESVVFVVSEESAKVDDETRARLAEVLGGETADGLLVEVVTVKFAPEVLAQPVAKVYPDGRTVRIWDWLGERIGALIQRGVKDGYLTADQAAELLQAERKRVLGPGLIGAVAASPSGEAVESLRAAFEAVGGIKKYVKV